MPIEIINPIPSEILAGGTGGGNYVLSSDSFDIALDGQPFILATSDQRPLTREVPDINKQKFDNFAEPGEYSLQDWWLRSQQEWGGGEGILYQDPSVDQRYNIKYRKSTGINVWKPGEISLLPEALAAQLTQLNTSTSARMRGYFEGTDQEPSLWFSVIDKLYSHDFLTGAVTTINYSGADPEAFIISITSTGNRYYVATREAIYTGVGTGVGTKIWTLPDTSSDVVIEWVKGRLMLGYGPSIYELATGGPTLPTPVFTHLNPSWGWTSITEGPTAIYFSGDSYPDSSIYKLVLEVDGAVPTLTSGGTIAAPMPPGEIVNTIYCYLGTFIGISSNRGFRVGVIDAQGDIAYGPLLWNGPSRGIIGEDRFFYVSVKSGIDLDFDVESQPTNTFSFASSVTDTNVVWGLYRVDLGQELQSSDGSSLRYAYSTDRYLVKPQDDADPADGNMGLSDFCLVGDRLIAGIYQSIAGDNGWLAYWPTDREFEEGVFDYSTLGGYSLLPSGQLQTGRVGFNTLEPKTFRYFSVRAPAPLEGNIDVDFLDENDDPTRYMTYTPANPPDVGDIPLSAIITPEKYGSLRFTLNRSDTDVTKGAVMNGWQLKAMPAPIRMREFTMTLLCFDTEQDKTGQEIGYEGYALERLLRLEQTAQRGNVITLQDLYNDIASQVIIQQMQFAQFAPPGPVSKGYGGYITLRMKTVSDVIG